VKCGESHGSRHGAADWCRQVFHSDRRQKAQERQGCSRGEQPKQNVTGGFCRSLKEWVGEHGDLRASKHPTGPNGAFPGPATSSRFMAVQETFAFSSVFVPSSPKREEKGPSLSKAKKVNQIPTIQARPQRR